VNHHLFVGTDKTTSASSSPKEEAGLQAYKQPSFAASHLKSMQTRNRPVVTEDNASLR
jgi:hypothetical protein